MKSKKTAGITYAGLTAALYVVLTLVSSAFGLSSGIIQLRLSEALCILPCFFPPAIYGLFAGCILANILSGCMLWDVVFGSIATLIGAVGAYLLRKYRFLAPLPTVIANTLIIPFVLAFVYGFDGGIPYFILTVGVGELISAELLGCIAYGIVKRSFFPKRFNNGNNSRK